MIPTVESDRRISPIEIQFGIPFQLSSAPEQKSPYEYVWTGDKVCLAVLERHPLVDTLQPEKPEIGTLRIIRDLTLAFGEPLKQLNTPTEAHQEPAGSVSLAYILENGKCRIDQESLPREVRICLGNLPTIAKRRTQALMVYINPFNKNPFQFLHGSQIEWHGLRKVGRHTQRFTHWTAEGQQMSRQLFPGTTTPFDHDSTRDLWWVLYEGKTPTREMVLSQIAEIKKQRVLARVQQLRNNFRIPDESTI